MMASAMSPASAANAARAMASRVDGPLRGGDLVGQDDDAEGADGEVPGWVTLREHGGGLQERGHARAGRSRSPSVGLVED